STTDRPASRTRSLHDALPISGDGRKSRPSSVADARKHVRHPAGGNATHAPSVGGHGQAGNYRSSATDRHVRYFIDSGSRLLPALDRKSTRLNSSHQIISYAVF